MTNKTIASNLDLLSKFMELYDEDSFKIRAYQNAARNIKDAPYAFSELSEKEIYIQKGIGKATGNKIIELLQTGSIEVLERHLAETPAGIIEMMSIRGIGIKKIKAIWKELNIVTSEELLQACKNNLLSGVKGFGAKTQINIAETLEYFIKSRDKHLLATVLNFSRITDAWLKENVPNYRFLLTGDVYNQKDIISNLLWVTNAKKETITEIAKALSLSKISEEPEDEIYTFENGIKAQFVLTDAADLEEKQFAFSCSEAFLQAFVSLYDIHHKTEKEIFSQNDLQYVPPFLRNNKKWIAAAQEHMIPDTIQTNDIKGIIHCHSNWSDGGNTIEVIVQELMYKQFEYLVLTDHSKSAFYANGLQPERVIAQHNMIDNLNKKYPDFKIFKGIESDILNDGRLDYDPDILDRFDIVIASIHSNLKMNEEAATERIIKAIEHKNTNILGHMTGRLLLMRNGYPVNHKKIIDACAANQVVIELNANPRRLDIDWRFIDYALEKDVLISINPDAHNLHGLYDIHYGVLSAQKSGLTASQNLSSFSLAQFEMFLQQQKTKRKGKSD